MISKFTILLLATACVMTTASYYQGRLFVEKTNYLEDGFQAANPEEVNDFQFAEPEGITYEMDGLQDNAFQRSYSLNYTYGSRRPSK